MVKAKHSNSKILTPKSCSLFALFANIFLFVIKAFAGVLSGSIAVISDALNSLTDIISSIAIMVSVKVSSKSADEKYPFGRGRAEPVAGLIVAIIAAFLGIEVIRNAFVSLFERPEIEISVFTVLVVAITLLMKFFMFFLFKLAHIKNKFHPSLRALAIDSINDVWIAIFILVGFMFYFFEIVVVDSIIGMLIGLWIIKSGWDVGVENSGYLLGKRPPKDVIEHIQKIALSVKGVRGINDVFAHYIGPNVHVEVHIEVDKSLRVVEAHDLAKKVKKKIEKYNIVTRAFIHIDPRKSMKRNNS